MLTFRMPWYFYQSVLFSCVLINVKSFKCGVKDGVFPVEVTVLGDFLFSCVCHYFCSTCSLQLLLLLTQLHAMASAAPWSLTIS